MSDTWLRRLAWLPAVLAIVMLVVSAVMLALAPNYANGAWLENQVRSIVTLGAPILGLIIVSKQPRHRIGWLWIVYGVVAGFRTLGHAIYFSSGSQSAGYSALEYFLLWSTEAVNFAGFTCLILLMLWFPDGKLPSRRWRYLYIWLVLTLLTNLLFLFNKGTNWNGGADAGGIIIDNPYGWLTVTPPFVIGFSAFLSIVLILILAAVSLLFRYHSAGRLERLQLRWFIFGGISLVGLYFFPVFFIGDTQEPSVPRLILEIISHAAIVPLYLAVGIAILRYHLYDFDVIVRKTAVYAILTGLLAMLYFGLVILLQSLVGRVTVENSPLIIVVSTLVIAALFSPLRRRIQAFIDRRFFRQKYDAQQILAQFAQTARDETDMDRLSVELLKVVQETMQPVGVTMWLKKVER